MKNCCVTLVDPGQIAKKGYTGCTSSKAVMTFAKKHGVPCMWWKPTTGQKVLLIEPKCFGTTWKQVQGGNTHTHTNTRGSNTSRTKTGWGRTTAKKSNSTTTGTRKGTKSTMRSKNTTTWNSRTTTGKTYSRPKLQRVAGGRTNSSSRMNSNRRSNTYKMRRAA